MKALLFVPIVLSLIVLGAHFFRESSEVGVVVSIVLIGLLFVRRRWAARIVQAALVIGAVEWILTIYSLAWIYAARGDPPARMYMIVGGVTVVTLFSALLFQTKALKKMYGLESKSRPEGD